MLRCKKARDPARALLGEAKVHLDDPRNGIDPYTRLVRKFLEQVRDN